MPRLHHVAKARFSKKPRKCYRCGVKIKIGEPYYWFANRMGRASIRKEYCQAHRPKPSDMTTSDKLSRLYAAQEGVEDILRGQIPREEWDDYKEEVASALDNAAQEAREVGEEYTQSRDNMPEGLQDSPTGSDCEEKAQACDTWADELESAASDIRGMEAPEPEEKPEPEEGDAEADAEEDEEEDVDCNEIDDAATTATGGLSI